MKKTKRNSAIIVLLVLLIAIAVGYAAFQTVLTINGTVTTSANWNVKFTDAKLLDKNGDTDSNHGTVTKTDTVVTAEIDLKYPGDAVNLRTVITNGGNLDAKLTKLEIDKSGLEGKDITVTEATHTQGTLLEAGQSCTSDFVVQWVPTSTKDSTSGSFSVKFTYDQDAQAITISPTHSDS